MVCVAAARRPAPVLGALSLGLAAALVLGGAGAGAAADIYRCIGADGVVHFSNAPTSDCFKRIIKVETVRPEPTPPASAEGNAPAAGYARYASLILDAARRHELDPALLTAVIRAESNFDPAAVSRRGAKGLMQLMPKTSALYGVADPLEPHANIDTGAKHLRSLLERYRNNLELALAAYNAGEEAVERHGGRIPPFGETRGYVKAVLRHLQTYRGAGVTAGR